MADLLWFSGITFDTPMRDIGWTWLFLIVAVLALIGLVIDFWGKFRG